MGTDIHGKFFVKRTGYNDKPYWQDLEPAFRYRWNDDVHLQLWDEMLGTTISARLKETMKNFPEYRAWVDGLDADPMAKAAVEASGDSYLVHVMLAQNYKHTALAVDTEFHKANGALNAVLDRNYTFFAAVGNVRNGYGFAGVDTGDALPFIGDYRGFEELPFKVDNSDWDFGDHSFGWASLSELTAYNWDRTYKVRGYVPVLTDPQWPMLDSLEKMRQEGRTIPNGWSGGVGGTRVWTVSLDEAAELIADRTRAEPGKTYYSKLEWEQSIRSQCAAQVEAIEWLGERLPLDTTYFVFGFDS